eukprot:scaffold2952_cov312-Pinguiococcus_pyrenoidosus.AAC.21
MARRWPRLRGLSTFRLDRAVEGRRFGEDAWDNFAKEPTDVGVDGFELSSDMADIVLKSPLSVVSMSSIMRANDFATFAIGGSCAAGR